MIQYFTSVITWFKDISSSLLSWFFDTSNTNKVLIFIVPLFVIAGIFVLFDFIVPMFFDFPVWRINKQVSVMTPKNTFGLIINKHLIPRTPYSIRRMFFNRFSGGLIRSYSSKTLKAFSTKDIKPFQSRDLKGFKVSDLKGYKVYDIRNFKTSDLRVLKSTDLRLFSTSELRSFTPDKISNFNIIPISTIRLSGLNPAEIRSFKVSEIKPISMGGLRTYKLSSSVISSSISPMGVTNKVVVPSKAFKVDSHRVDVKSANAGKANS